MAVDGGAVGPPLLASEQEDIEELLHSIHCAEGLGLLKPEDAASLASRARGEEDRTPSAAQLFDALILLLGRVLVAAASRDMRQSLTIADARQIAREVLGL